jgi:hypothetical protein
MNLIRVSLAASMASSFAPAQLAIEASFVADTDLVARARVFNTFEERRLPAGTDLTTRPVLTATLGSATGTTAVQWTNTGAGLLAVVEEVASAGGMLTAASTGQHSALLELKSARPTTVRVRAVVAGSTFSSAHPGIGASFGGAVDFGADGTWEVAGPGVAQASGEWVITLHHEALRLRTRSGGSCGVGDTTGGFESRGTVVIEVRPVENVTVDLITATAVSAAVSVANVSAAAAVAAGAPLWPRTLLVADAYGGRTTLRADLQVTPGRVTASLEETMSLPCIGGYRGSLPPHDVVLVLRGSRPTAVRLSLAIGAFFSPPGRWSSAIDVGDDGSFELVNSSGGIVRVVIPATIGAGGLRVRARAEGASNGGCGTPAAGTITIDVWPRCEGVQRGSECGVSLVGVAALDDTWRFDVSGLTGGALGKLVFGVDQFDLPLPFSAGCRLYTEPTIALPFVADEGGRRELALALPAEFQGVFSVQALALRPASELELAGSAALDIACR